MSPASSSELLPACELALHAKMVAKLVEAEAPVWETAGIQIKRKTQLPDTSSWFLIDAVRILLRDGF